MPYRVFVPPTWDGKTSLPIILMLHGAGADENTYMNMSDGLLPKLAAQHGYIVVSPLGFTAMGAYGNPLRLPAVFGESAAAATQRAAVTPVRQRELNLSELEVMTALEVVTEEYGADRSRTFLVGHSMGSGGAWHLAARYPERWRAVAPMSGPFVDVTTYPFDRIRKLPIFMTEGTGATPSLEGSRAMAKLHARRRLRVRVPRGRRQPREHGADGMAARVRVLQSLQVSRGLANEESQHGTYMQSTDRSSLTLALCCRVGCGITCQHRRRSRRAGFGRRPSPPPRSAPGPYAVTVESYPTLARTRRITRPSSTAADRRSGCRSCRGATARAPATGRRSPRS